MSNTRIILIGKGGSGKDFFKSFLKQKGYILDVSHTSRPAREGEVHGEDYIFVEKDHFESSIEIGRFYEYAFFNNNYYGTTNRSWHNSDIFIMETEGLSKVSDADLANSIVVYFDIDEDVLRSRLEARSDSNDTVERRIERDKIDFKNFNGFDIRVTNPEYDPEELLGVLTKHYRWKTI